MQPVVMVLAEVMVAEVAVAARHLLTEQPSLPEVVVGLEQEVPEVLLEELPPQVPLEGQEVRITLALEEVEEAGVRPLLELLRQIPQELQEELELQLLPEQEVMVRFLQLTEVTVPEVVVDLQQVPLETGITGQPQVQEVPEVLALVELPEVERTQVVLLEVA